MKDPAFLFYYKDFEASTADWEANAVGWYIRLLCFQAENGYIPSDLESIAQVARVKFSEWKIFSDRWATRLATKFKPLSDGKLYNKKLAKVIATRKNDAVKKSVFAVFGNFIKHRKLSDYEEKMLKEKFDYKAFITILDSEQRHQKITSFLENIIEQIKHEREFSDTLSDRNKENVIVNENINEIEDEIEIVSVWPEFSDFWSAYDKKIGKEKCIAKWNKLSHQDREAIMQYIPAYKSAQPEKQYRKNPESFLNQKAWNDEIIKSNEQKRNSKISDEYRLKVAESLGLVQS